MCNGVWSRWCVDVDDALMPVRFGDNTVVAARDHLSAWREHDM